MSKNDKNARRQVEIAQDFQIGVHPVTQGQWQAVMGINPSWFSRTGGKERMKDISDIDILMFPVESVSWHDVQEFLERLNAKVKKGEWLYRLPTEAEWEYSCRGGATSQTDCSFDFYVGDTPSNDLPSKNANFRDSNLGRTSRVGSYRPDKLGLYDMHGNVWGWCQDAEGSVRVIRGGSWYSHGSSCTAAIRGWRGPSCRIGDLGVRLARSSPSGL